MKKSGTCITKRNPQTVKGRGTGEDDIGLRFGKDLTNLYKANAPKGCNKKQGLKTSPPASLKASKTRGQKRAINSKVVVSKACRSKQQSYKAGLFSVDKVNLQIPALASVVHHDIAEYLIRSEVRGRLTVRNNQEIEMASK